MREEELLDRLCIAHLQQRGYVVRRIEISADMDKVDFIKLRVATHYAVPLSALRGRERTVTVARARHVAMYLTRELTKLSLSEIEKEFDRGHGSVAHGYKTVDDLLRNADADTVASVRKLRIELGNSLH